MATLESELRQAYAGKKVLLTGHTGFKGSWLLLWLEQLGAEVTGFALAAEPGPSMFEGLKLERRCRHIVGDLRDAAHLGRVLTEVQPDYVFHLGAQPLVRRSYEAPLETIETNILGTAHLLEALRRAPRRCAVVVVTSDKCYENREWAYGYREEDPMGGHDVYSMSKGAAELLVSSYRRSFFHPDRISEHGVALATARAGNVIGGGDWARDRILPDIVRALAEGRPVEVRNPNAVRPWQHVLEPLSGYLVLGARLSAEGAKTFASSWNFGPQPGDACPVREIVQQVIAHWGTGSWEERPQAGAPHEAGYLRLNIDKAVSLLGWSPRWRLKEAIRRTTEWYRQSCAGQEADALCELSRQQINDYVREPVA